MLLDFHFLKIQQLQLVVPVLFNYWFYKFITLTTQILILSMGTQVGSWYNIILGLQEKFNQTDSIPILLAHHIKHPILKLRILIELLYFQTSKSEKLAIYIDIDLFYYFNYQMNIHFEQIKTIFCHLTCKWENWFKLSKYVEFFCNS